MVQICDVHGFRPWLLEPMCKLVQVRKILRRLIKAKDSQSLKKVYKSIRCSLYIFKTILRVQNS